jgi:hypothetical protein
MLLRTTLVINGVSTALCGLALLLAPGALAELLGVSPAAVILDFGWVLGSVALVELGILTSLGDRIGSTRRGRCARFRRPAVLGSETNTSIGVTSGGSGGRVARLPCARGGSMATARLCFVAIACLTVGGCVVSHPAYPPAWAPLVRSPACPSLGGTYEDRGIEGETGASTFRSQSVSASRFFFPKDQIARSATTITVSEPEADTVEIVASNRNVSLISRRLVAARGDFRCRDGTIEFSSSQLVGAQQVAGVQWDTLQLAKASDGALVLRHASSGVGLIVVVPAGGSEHRWYRFPLHVD